MPWFRGRTPEPTAPPPAPSPSAPGAIVPGTVGPPPWGLGTCQVLIHAAYEIHGAGTVATGVVVSGRIRLGMSLWLRSAATGVARPQPVEVVSIRIPRSERSALHPGVSSMEVEAAEAGPAEVGFVLRGLRRSEISRGDSLMG